MAGISHAAQIDLCLGDLARQLVGFRISCASVSTSLDNAVLEQTGRLSAWRSEFLAARARPWAVLGPELARAFARLALILRSLVKPRFFLGLASSRSL